MSRIPPCQTAAAAVAKRLTDIRAIVAPLRSREEAAFFESLRSRAPDYATRGTLPAFHSHKLNLAAGDRAAIGDLMSKISIDVSTGTRIQVGSEQDRLGKCIAAAQAEVAKYEPRLEEALNRRSEAVRLQNECGQTKDYSRLQEYFREEREQDVEIETCLAQRSRLEHAIQGFKKDLDLLERCGQGTLR